MLMLCLLYEQTKEEEEEKYFSTLRIRLETQRSNRMKKKDCHIFFFFFSLFFSRLEFSSSNVYACIQQASSISFPSENEREKQNTSIHIPIHQST
jgi:hypothetical protein